MKCEHPLVDAVQHHSRLNLDLNGYISLIRESVVPVNTVYRSCIISYIKWHHLRWQGEYSEPACRPRGWKRGWRPSFEMILCACCLGGRRACRRLMNLASAMYES